MKKINGFTVVLVTLGSIALLGIILPFLISSKTDELPLIGIAIISIIAGFIIDKIIKGVRKQ